MAFEISENTGSLWPNDKKGVESRPDKQGKIKLGGQEYYISAWTKTTAAGVSFDSLSIKPVEATQAPKQDPVPQSYGDKDEIPF